MDKDRVGYGLEQIDMLMTIIITIITMTIMIMIIMITMIIMISIIIIIIIIIKIISVNATRIPPGPGMWPATCHGSGAGGDVVVEN